MTDDWCWWSLWYNPRWQGGQDRPTVNIKHHLLLLHYNKLTRKCASSIKWAEWNMAEHSWKYLWQRKYFSSSQVKYCFSYLQRLSSISLSGMIKGFVAQPGQARMSKSKIWVTVEKLMLWWWYVWRMPWWLVAGSIAKHSDEPPSSPNSHIKLAGKCPENTMQPSPAASERNGQ